MKPAIAAILIVLTALPASAETCRDKFVKLFTDRSSKGGVKIHVTQEIKGGMTMKNYNYQAGADHWMTEMIEPANMQWTLVYNNVMFTSSDKGKTWKKIRALDSAHSQEATQKKLNEAAATIANAKCGTEEIDGVLHDTVEADYDYPAYKSSHHDKYWINPDTGWISKSAMKTTQASFESLTTQLIEPAPDLKLPTPK